MKRLMIALVRLYKKFISPILPPACRFTPSCSTYAIEAFEKRGFFVGMFLTAWRILRCNPFGKAGYDPVPETGLIPMILRKNEKDGQSAPCHHDRDAQENTHELIDESANNTKNEENSAEM